VYIDINALFTFEMSKSDDQSILAAIVPNSDKDFYSENNNVSQV
jgi:hypothetical protein